MAAKGYKLKDARIIVTNTIRMVRDVTGTLLDEIMEVGEDIVSSHRFAKAMKVPHHHKGRNIASHSVETAEYALMLCRKLAAQGVTVNEVDAVRTALLHDIGMTEDEVFLSPSPIKAYTHPVEGARIAKEEFGANDVQVDAILRHMWPIGFIPPKSIEGWVVVAADKCCSVHEVSVFARKLLSSRGL